MHFGCSEPCAIKGFKSSKRLGLSLNKSKIENKPIRNHPNWQDASYVAWRALVLHYPAMTTTQSLPLRSFSVAVTGRAREKKMSVLSSRSLWNLESEDLSPVKALHLGAKVILNRFLNYLHRKLLVWKRRITTRRIIPVLNGTSKKWIKSWQILTCSAKDDVTMMGTVCVGVKLLIIVGTWVLHLQNASLFEMTISHSRPSTPESV